MIYSCDAKILQYGRDNDSLTEVLSHHLKGVSNNNVKLVNIEKQTYDRIPKRIINFFPNLVGLMMQDTELRNISSYDLKPFPKLQYLSLVANELEYLENDLFIHTPNIVYINLAWNYLQNIGTDIFEPLKSLKTLSLFRNPCSDTEVWKGTAAEVAAAKNEIAVNCKPTMWMIRLEEERRKKKMNIIRKNELDLKTLF